MIDLNLLIDRYGANPAGLIRFGADDSPDLLPYTTLVAPRNGDAAADLNALAGVYEWQDNPLMFLVDGDMIDGDGARLGRIRRRIALRGDTPYLGVIEAGRLTVYRVALDSKPIEHSAVDLRSAAPVLFPYLANERPRAAIARRQWISELILRLLKDALHELIAAGLSDTDAISLGGRALFARFLGDRGMIPESLAAPDAVHSLFDDPTKAATTSTWLDATFNGDFLPLSPGRPERMPKAAFATLSDIMRRAPHGQLFLGWQERWDYLDFSQIPVGVLSQAYEGYLRTHRANDQKKQGGYYTPRPIAEVLVRGALVALRAEGRAHTARILDPAVGGGVFLITAFRQLVAEHWTATGVRPDTGALREILYNQLTGFDIDEAALRFAALGLYLCAIELDPRPEPLAKLRFENLRGRVLYKVGDLNANEGDGRLGSLGSAVGIEHAGQYDLVVGNPPWTGARRIPGWSQVRDQVTRIARARLGPDYPAPPIPNEVPDLAFLWRAMDWARHDGRVAFALHARLLFQQGDGMPKARSAIFSALDVTGIVNGADLRRQTNVWPTVSAPFCLLFARNRLPPPGAGFRFLNPRQEQAQNDAGVMRIDPTNAEAVSACQVIGRPTILKTLFRGTRLDLELLERIEAKGLPTLDQYWRHLFGEERHRARQTGNGYQRLRDSTKNPQSAACLIGLPELVIKGLMPLSIDVDRLPRFAQIEVHRVRQMAIYRGPLVIVQETPPADQCRIHASVSNVDTVYSQSYYGYSTAGHPAAHTLARFIVLLLGSRFSLWYALVTSGKFGVERDTIEKFTIDDIPVIPFEDLDAEARSRIDSLFSDVATADNDDQWGAVDSWVAHLLGLKERDIQVIADTLDCNLPFARNVRLSQTAVSIAQTEAFNQALTAALQPWGNRLGLTVSVTQVSPSEGVGSWQVLRVSTSGSGHHPSSADDNLDWAQIIRLADRMAAVEILHPDPGNRSVWIARLRQRRYWSLSQARILAQRIIGEQTAILFGEVLP
ncbi:HsdM family class I SAM-dependent methyltransferase [Thiocystis violascens]|uniref:site-specific DNA-methyltransferase (adenine-specific) n=1 Tax=Thiocystis violascens (strain ATCC 17096 / DSM 198 / 6111) TaxID=765911 RepID=I3Y953_THIV6|nr:N-6 DNA methylase [Thiocystis violascens]AFL73521.1 type I restriction-modification system methyltransferase subunit [Thiocystis violascens DSM 198]